MMELITLAAAQAIAKVAFDKFVEGGAGELGKTSSKAIAEKVMQLGTVVWKRIKGNTTAVTVLEGAAQDQPEEVRKLKNYLYALWKDENSDFVQEVKKLADEIHFELTQVEDNSSMTMIVHPNGKGWQTKVEGGTAYVGEIHIQQSSSQP